MNDYKYRKGDIVTHKLTNERVIILKRLFFDPIDLYYRIRRSDFSIEETVEQATDTISDSFGSTWSAYCPECGKKTMQVVRPGKVQCANCGS